MRHCQRMRLVKLARLRGMGGVVDLMYLEVTRWRHVKLSLAFNSDPIPGTDIRPRPGLPRLGLHHLRGGAADGHRRAVRERLTGR